MGNSLQDQLKALGLARDKPGPGSSNRKPKKPGNTKSPRRKEPPGELSLEKAFALRKQEEKRSAAQAKQKKREEDRQRKQLNNAIREIVMRHRLNRDDAEIARNFMFRGRIRKIHVTPEQLKALNSGELGIAYLSGSYHLLTREQTEAVSGLSEQHVVDLADGGGEVDGGEDGEFPIPDDLIW